VIRNDRRVVSALIAALGAWAADPLMAADVAPAPPAAAADAGKAPAAAEKPPAAADRSPPAADTKSVADASTLEMEGVPAPLAARLLDSFVFFNGGSGVLIGGDGRILTCNHVIAQMRTYEVRLAGGVAVSAELLGTDPYGDIALLRIDPAQVPHELCGVDFAAPDTMRAGLPVIAVGNPFGLGDLDDQPTISRGVLGSGRVVRGFYTDAIQADAPVNPGNSGGPLFTYDGTLLGINGQIRSRSGFRINSGIGLAIDAPQLQAFLPALTVAGGNVVHHTAAPPGLKLETGRDGVVVTTGVGVLQNGDILLEIGGRPALSVPTAMGIFAASPWQPGATMAVTVLRAGVRTDLDVACARTPIPGQPYHGLDFDERAGGTVISGVDADSPGATAGVRRGDLVLKANGRPVTSRISLLRAMLGLEAGDDLVLDLRDAAGTVRTARISMRLP